MAVDHHTDVTVIAPCPSHESHAVAKKIFKQRMCWAFQASLCAMASAVGASEVFTKNFQCQALRCKQLLLILRGKRVELSRALPPSRKWRARRPDKTKWRGEECHVNCQDALNQGAGRLGTPPSHTSLWQANEGPRRTHGTRRGRPPSNGGGRGR